MFAHATEDVIYVSSAGSDSNNGQSSATAVATFERAFDLLPSGGRIVLCGSSYSVGANFSMPSSSKKYTLTSEMSGALSYSGTLTLNSDMTIENITLSGKSTPIIVCSGHNVTFGHGITNIEKAYIVGGHNVTSTST